MLPLIQTAVGRLPLLKDVIGDAHKMLGALSESSRPSRSGFSHDLTVSFGDVSQKGVHDMGQHTLNMVCDVTRQLENTESHAYDDIEKILTGSFFVDTKQERHIAKSDVILIKKDEDEDEDDSDADDDDADNEYDVSFEDEPSAETLRHLRSWLVGIIDDAEITKELNLDDKAIYNIACAVAKHVRCLREVNRKREAGEAPILHVSNLRYPDADSQLFKLYRLKLHVKQLTELELVDIKRKHGLYAEFSCLKLHGHEAMTARLDEADHTRQKTKALEFFGHRGQPISL